MKERIKRWLGVDQPDVDVAMQYYTERLEAVERQIKQLAYGQERLDKLVDETALNHAKRLLLLEMKRKK